MRLKARSKSCKCGCGQPALGRGRYVPDHFEILVAARRRLREARRNAWRKGVPFHLDLASFVDLVKRAWPKDRGLALQRIDRRLGYVQGNVMLAPVQGGRRSGLTPAKLGRRLQRLANRADLTGRITVAELHAVYATQRGRCAVSGRILKITPALRDPDAVALVLRDPGKPVTPANLLFVTASVQHAARWGLSAFVDLASSTARHQKRLATDR